MAILNGLSGRHLDDAALAAIWTGNAQTSDTIVDPHLQACAECRVRFAAFSSWMEDLRLEAIAEADAAFPADRLAAQQAQILRRLEAAERPARVIAFPNGPATEPVRPVASIRRWVAAAAAAGLIVGVGLGQIMDFGDHGGPAAFPAANRTVLNQPRGEAQPSAIQPVSTSSNDENQLEELEAAATPRYDTLRAYDAFTPRAADYIKPR